MISRRRLILSGSAAAPALLLGQAPAQRSENTQHSNEKLPAPVRALKNRAHEATPITAAEREHRLERAREVMQQHKIAALTISGGTSLLYFLGIAGGQSERIFAWTLPASGAPFIVCPHFEEGRMTEAMHTVPGGGSTKIYTWQEDEDPYALLAKSLKAHTTSPLPLALDERMQFVFADRIAKAVAPRQTVSGIPIVSGCRSIKSPAELALMQLAN